MAADKKSDEVCPQCYLFLKQKASELTFHYALDSYKAPSLNAPFIAKEAIQSMSFLLKSGKGEESLKVILEELKERISGNEIASKLLKLEKKKYIGFDLSNLSSIELQLGIISRHLDPFSYFETAYTLLMDALVTKKKSRISYLSGELITTLINIGVSPSHIYSAVNFHLKPAATRRPETSLKRFYDAIEPISHNFKVCMGVKISTDSLDENHIELFGIKTFEALPEPFDTYSSDHEIKTLVDGEVYVEVSGIQARDAHTALKEARNRTSVMFDSIRLFDHKAEFSMRENALVEQCCIEGIQTASYDRNRMHFIANHDPWLNSEKVSALLGNIRFRVPDERRKFFRVVDLHGASISTEVLENQLLNIWICLETITSGNPQKSIISNVISSLVPVICTNYVHRIVNDLLVALQKTKRKEIAAVLREIDKGKYENNAILLFELLSNTENQMALQEFAKCLDDRPLIRNRLFQLWKAFSLPEKMLELIRQHEKRVTWQLHRIFRTRNAIVHTGETPSYASSLVENAHDYFDQVFFAVCKLASGQNGLETFEQCFGFASQEFDELVSKLSNRNEFDEEILTLLFDRT